MGAYIVNILAAIFSLVIQNKNSISKSFVVTIAILPSVVCVVIMMVNGSMGIGVAVTLNYPSEEKELLDQIRVRNGNLEVSCSLMSTVNSEL